MILAVHEVRYSKKDHPPPLLRVCTAILSVCIASLTDKLEGNNKLLITEAMSSSGFVIFANHHVLKTYTLQRTLRILSLCATEITAYIFLHKLLLMNTERITNCLALNPAQPGSDSLKSGL